MLLYKINNKLRNGSRGKFIGLKEAENGEDQRVVVRFPTTGTVSLERRTWPKYNKNGIVQGSRTQFPITPCYAITAHKAQGLTHECSRCPLRPGICVWTNLRCPFKSKRGGCSAGDWVSTKIVASSTDGVIVPSR